MHWYIAKIVFRIICGEGNHKPQFDEQLRLINAIDERQAYIKAELVGRQEQDSFLNYHMKLVHWEYINISELYKLAALTDGVELYSRVTEADDAGKYIDIVNKKSEQICETFETNAIAV